MEIFIIASKISPSKNYIEGSAIIQVLDQETLLTIQSPNGGDTLKGTQTITWTIDTIEGLSGYSISIQYRYNNQRWMMITSGSS